MLFFRIHVSLLLTINAIGTLGLRLALNDYCDKITHWRFQEIETVIIKLPHA